MTVHAMHGTRKTLLHAISTSTLLFNCDYMLSAYATCGMYTYMPLLSQAVLSRAELYMVSNVIDGSEALTIAGDVMQIMVQAWRQQDKEDDELRYKQAQSLEYKTKSHEVCFCMQ